MTERNAKVTTRTGDDGYTGLLGAGRVPKWDPRMETIGTLDEATSALGLARAQVTAPGVAETIHALQRDLYLLMGELATPPENYEQMGLRITAADVARLDAHPGGISGRACRSATSSSSPARPSPGRRSISPARSCAVASATPRDSCTKGRSPTSRCCVSSIAPPISSSSSAASKRAATAIRLNLPSKRRSPRSSIISS